MAIQTIQYQNKVALNTNPEIADINKVTDNDMNEIKSVVNNNANNAGDLSNLTTPTTDNLVNAINSIVESGSNANGNWIKYSDGTMLCWKTYTFSNLAFNTAWGSVYESAYQEFGATPQTFISTPTIFTNNGNGAMAGIEGLNNTTTNSFGRTQLYRPVSGTASGAINLLAIGRWK